MVNHKMFLCISIKSCNFDPVKIYAQKCLCRVRDHPKSKSVFPTDDSLFKMLYLAMMDITKKWTGRRQDWSVICAQLTIFFGDRIPPNSRNRLARQGPAHRQCGARKNGGTATALDMRSVFRLYCWHGKRLWPSRLTIYFQPVLQHGLKFSQILG